MPTKVKETFYFDSNYIRGQSWYSNHFINCNQQLLVTEVAPTYFHSHDATRRIRNDIGIIPLVCTLRNPVEKTYSLYLHMLRYGKTKLKFIEALEKHPELIDSAKYATHLERWIDSFHYENILILFQDNLKKSPEMFISELCDFLRIPNINVDLNINHRVNEAALPYSWYLAFIGRSIANKLRTAEMYNVIEFAKRIGLRELFFGRPGAHPLPKLCSEDRLHLLEILLPEIEHLEKIINVDLIDWKS